MAIGKLYGVGVGPGDPELLTLKAERILNEVATIFTPKSGPNRSSLALEIIEQIIDCQERVEELVFPMSYNPQVLQRSWNQAVTRVVTKIKKGCDVAFISIGDPLFYSTYIYVLNHIKDFYPEVEIETIPGITAMNASTARLNLPLARGDEKVLILPKVTSETEMVELMHKCDTVIVLKVSRNYKQLMAALDQAGLKRNSVLVSRCGLPQEKIIRDPGKIEKEDLDYLSLVISKRNREETA